MRKQKTKNEEKKEYAKEKKEFIKRLIDSIEKDEFGFNGVDHKIEGLKLLRKEECTNQFIKAVKDSDTEKMNSLLNSIKHEKIDPFSINNCFLLHHATKMNSIEAVEILIKRGAGVNLYDKEDMLPLTYAVKQKNVLIVMELLNAGANVNPRQNSKFREMLDDIARFKWDKKAVHIFKLLHLEGCENATYHLKRKGEIEDENSWKNIQRREYEKEQEYFRTF